MGKKDLLPISYTLTDVETGEILKHGIRDFDFRYRSERAFIHSLLDDFFDDALAHRDHLLNIEFQIVMRPLQPELPFF